MQRAHFFVIPAGEGNRLATALRMKSRFADCRGVTLAEALVAAALASLVMALGFGLWRNQTASGPSSRLDPGLSDDLQLALPLLRKDLRSSEMWRLSGKILELSVTSLDAAHQPSLATITWTWDSAGMSRTTPNGSRRFGPKPSETPTLRLSLTLHPGPSNTLDLTIDVQSSLGVSVFRQQEKLMAGASGKQ